MFMRISFITWLTRQYYISIFVFRIIFPENVTVSFYTISTVEGRRMQWQKCFIENIRHKDDIQMQPPPQKIGIYVYVNFEHSDDSFPNNTVLIFLKQYPIL